MKSKYSNFTKLFVSIVIVSSALLIQSCSNLDTESLSDQSLQSTVPQNSVFRVYDKTYNTPKGLHIWEAQLNKTIEMDTNMVRDGLKLIRYEYIQKIASTKDLETVKTELKKDNSLFIVYKDNSSHFSISENKELAKSYSNCIDSLLPTSEGVLQAIRAKGDSSLLAKAAYYFKKNDMGVVNLVWEYKGKTLNTRCLVSNEKGIIYDKFLFSVRTTVSKITSVRSNSSKAPQALQVDGDHIGKEFHISYQTFNNSAYLLAECGVSASILGNWYQGAKFATHFDVSYYARSLYSNLDWNYAALIIPVGFLPTSSTSLGSLRVAYGIVKGRNASIYWTGDAMIYSGELESTEGTYVDLYDYEMEDYNW